MLVAVLFSFNAGRSRTRLAGLLDAVVLRRPAAVGLARRQPAHRADATPCGSGVLATAITVPLGVAFALGLDRWRGRLPPGRQLRRCCCRSCCPRSLLAVALLFVVTQVRHAAARSARPAQVVGLVTFQLSYPVVIVRARLLTIGKQYEEAAVDLGASPIGAVRRVLLPMLMPAIFASAVLVFADVIDDFVIVRYLSGDSSTEPMSVKIYNTARAAPTPGAERAGDLDAARLVLAVVIGFVVYRWLTRGEKDVVQHRELRRRAVGDDPVLRQRVDGRDAACVRDGARLTSVDPVTGEPWAEAADSGARRRRRRLRQPRPRRSRLAADDATASGCDALLAAADLLAAHADELAALEVRDTGKPRRVVDDEEIPPTLDQLRFFAGAARMLEGRAVGEYEEG